MEEHKNSEVEKWADHGVIKYKDLINNLLEESTNTKNLPEEEKQWITHSLHTNNSIPFYKAKQFVGGAQITPYQKIKQYLLEVQSRQNLVEHNEYWISKLDLEMARDNQACEGQDPESYEYKLVQLEIKETINRQKQYKINLRHVQKERNSFLQLIREFNQSPQGRYHDGRLLMDVLNDDEACNKLEYEYWTYRMAKQTAMDWIAYGRPGVGNMDAVYQMDGEQQEEVIKLAIEIYTRNEMRNKRLQDEINEKIKQGLPPSKGALLFDSTEQRNVYHIQGRNQQTITEHNTENW
jgi:hypothetical protein